MHLRSEFLHSPYFVSQCGPASWGTWAGFCSKLPGRPLEPCWLCSSRHWASAIKTSQEVVYRKKTKHKAYTMQTLGSWHKVFCFPDIFVEVCSMINAVITSTFSAPEKDCIFWGWWCVSPYLFGGAACTAPAVISLTTLIPCLLQCILSLPWSEKVKLRTSLSSTRI